MYLYTLKKTLIQDQIIQYIKDRRFFGFVECDIHTTEHLKDYFSEMTPVFKSTEVSLKDVSQHMQEHVKQHDIKDVPCHLLLTGSYSSKKNRTCDTIMYQSIPSLTIPLATPKEFFERANVPPPGYKESAKLRLLEQKNWAKTPPPGGLFSTIQPKNHKN